MNRKIKIILADDHAVVRAGLAAMLRYEKDITVLGEAEDGQAAARLAEKLHPDVAILDLMMPVMDGADAATEIARLSPETRTLILTTFGTSDSLSRAFRNGATGAVSKNLPKAELVDAIRRTAAGERVVSEDIERSLSEQSEAPDLTPRQIEFLQAVARGLTNKDIATLFELSPGGVKFNLAAIFAKLGAANRSEAIAIALSRNLIKI